MRSSAEPALRSATEGIAWPALPSPEASDLLALLYQLERSEWLPRECIVARQRLQLEHLFQHARAHSDFYGDRLRGAAELSLVPLLSRQELLTRAAAIDARELPKSHGKVAVVQTSGSTGEVVAVKRTSVTQLFWLALTMRDHYWHRRDFRRTLAVIRANIAAQDDEQIARRNGWGPPASMLHATGPSYALPLSVDVREQAKWLVARDPGYLLTYPTNLSALLDLFETGTPMPVNLIEVRTIGETMTLELRQRCRKVLGVPLVDTYSSQEVGVIALQCPESGLYHVQSESLIVEVLNDDDSQCAPGQIGRVVVTDLHNFATPLIRYELRDRAEVGPVCPCGRGLATLARIVGRERNMVVLPSGERHWPLVGLHRFREVGTILQYQLVQHSLEEVEMRLVTAPARLDGAAEQRLSRIVQEALGHPFRIRVSYFEGELARSSSGKFEEFLCLIPPLAHEP